MTVEKEHKVGAILKAMMMGYTVIMEDRKWALSDDFDLCIVAQNDESEEVLLSVGASFKHFVDMALSMKEEEYVRIVGSMALTQLKRSKNI